MFIGLILLRTVRGNVLVAMVYLFFQYSISFNLSGELLLLHDQTGSQNMNKCASFRLGGIDSHLVDYFLCVILSQLQGEIWNRSNNVSFLLLFFRKSMTRILNKFFFLPQVKTCSLSFSNYFVWICKFSSRPFPCSGSLGFKLFRCATWRIRWCVNRSCA